MNSWNYENGYTQQQPTHNQQIQQQQQQSQQNSGHQQQQALQRQQPLQHPLNQRIQAQSRQPQDQSQQISQAYLYRKSPIPPVYDQTHQIYTPYQYTYTDYIENQQNYPAQYEYLTEQQWEGQNSHVQPPPIKGEQVNSPLQNHQVTSSNTSHNSTPSTLPRLEDKKLKKLESNSPGTQKSLSKRSRMGCLTCRSRKKRCCESKPRCTECARLKLNCVWPKPGTEHKNKPKDAKHEENTIDHEIYGTIKVLRGIVEYRSDA